MIKSTDHRFKIQIHLGNTLRIKKDIEIKRKGLTK